MTIWRTSPAVPVRARPRKPERAAVSAPELAVMRSALDAIPNDTDPLDYDAWRNVLFAIHHATEGNDEGLTLAHEFSARSAKYDPEFIDNRFWPYAGATSGEVITERSLYALAATHGWQDPSIADDFEEIANADQDDFDALATAGAAQVTQGDTPTGRAEVGGGPDAAGGDDEGLYGKPAANALRFTPTPAHEFAVTTQLRWVIKGVLPHAELAVLYGESGSGKSFMALDMGAAVARGIEWRGNKVRQGKVVYIAAEGANGFRNRLRAYAHQHALDLKDVPLHVIHAAPNLLEKADALDVAKAILAVVGKPGLIIIDTLAQTMPGGNENAGEDMGKALAHCRGLHRATGGLVMLVHHSGKDASKGARGWSGLRAAADVELEVCRADDDRVLTVTKQKDGDDGGEYGFKLETVLVDFDLDGDEVTSCVVQHCEVAQGRGKKGPRGKNDQAVYVVVLDLQDAGGNEPTDDEVIAEFKNRTTDRRASEEERDLRPQTCKRSLKSLVEGGFLVKRGARYSLAERAENNKKEA